MVAFIPAGIGLLKGVAGRIAAKEAVKRSAAYVAKQKAKAKVKAEALKKTKVGQKGLGAFQKTKDFASGKNLSGKDKIVRVTDDIKMPFSKTTGINRLPLGRKLGRGIRDVAMTSAPIGVAQQVASNVSPLFTDEDMTAQNYANIIAAGLLGPTSLRYGRAGIQRLAPNLSKKMGLNRGTDIKPRMTKDASGKEVPMKDDMGRVIKDKYQLQMSDKTLRKDLTTGVGSGLVSATPFIFGMGGSPEKTTYPDTTLPKDEIAAQNEFTNLSSNQYGEEVKKVINLVKSKKGRYSDAQITQMLKEAEAVDKLTQEKGPIDGQPPDNNQSIAGGEGQPPISGNEKPPEAPGTGLDNEVDLKVNSEQAIGQADTTAKNMTNPAVTKPSIVNPNSPGDVLLQAEIADRDYSGMEKEMSRYQEFIESEQGKVLNYKEYMKRFKEMTGDDDQAGNIALFKWGMAMMTGRSNQNGLAGFMDIAGTAGLSLGEDLMAINERTREENRALAGSFLAYEQDAQKYLSGLEQQGLQQTLALQEKMLNDKVEDSNTLFNRQVALQQLHNQKLQYLQQIADRRNEAMEAGKLRTVLVKDDSRFKQRKKVYGQNKNGNLINIENFENGVQKNIPITQAEYNAIIDQDLQVDPGRAGKLYNRLQAANTGLKFTQIVADIHKQEGGVKLGSVGRFQDIFTNVKGLYNEWTGSKDVGLGGSINNLTDDQAVRSMLDQYYVNEAVKSGGTLNKRDQKDRNELMARFEKDNERARRDATKIQQEGINGSFVPKGIQKAYANKSLQEQNKIINQLAQLRLIENRMKYIVANANKGEDRLTVKDVDDAAKGTNILIFGKAGQTVAADYAAIANTLNDQYDGLAQSYITAGGNPDQLDSHTYTRSYINWQAEKGQNKGQTKTDEERIQDLVNKIKNN